MEARRRYRCVIKVTNDWKEEGYTSETFLPTKNIPHRWKGDANEALQMTERKRERKRDRERFQDERKVDEPPTRIPFATLHGLPR